MSLWRHYVHLIWTTKQRNLWITPTIEPQLYAYIVSKVVELDCYVYALNGMADHLHLVLALPPKHSVASVVKTLKGASSHFVNQVLRPAEFYFAWQRGYGCFSLGHTQLPFAIEYVQAQKEHHARMTTNAWLERSSDVDEPPPHGEASKQPAQILRESSVSYDVYGDMPF